MLQDVRFLGFEGFEEVWTDGCLAVALEMFDRQSLATLG